MSVASRSLPRCLPRPTSSRSRLRPRSPEPRNSSSAPKKNSPLPPGRLQGRLVELEEEQKSAANEAVTLRLWGTFGNLTSMSRMSSAGHVTDDLIDSHLDEA